MDCSWITKRKTFTRNKLKFQIGNKYIFEIKGESKCYVFQHLIEMFVFWFSLFPYPKVLCMWMVFYHFKKNKGFCPYCSIRISSIAPVDTGQISPLYRIGSPKWFNQLPKVLLHSSNLVIYIRGRRQPMFINHSVIYFSLLIWLPSIQLLKRLDVSIPGATNALTSIM